MEESPSATCVPADFNLRNWATITYTATLWDKSKISPFFDKTNRTGTTTYIHKMVQEKEKELESANFPRKISDEILCLFKTMGQRIALWCEYATEVLGIDKEVIPTVCWTVYGTIDEAKILKNATSLINIENEVILPLEALYYTACSNVSIDYIQLHWKEMLKFCEVYSREEKFLGQSPAKPKLQFIASSVIFLAKVELSQLFSSHIENFECIKKEGMFWLSLREGCPKAVRYYWSLLNESQKSLYATYAADYALGEYGAGEKYDFFNKERILKGRTFLNYRNKCFADLLIFFVTLMSENKLSEYLSSLKTQGKHFIFTILEVLMCHWPLKEFLPSEFDSTSKYCDDLSDCKKIIERLIEVITMNKDFGLDNKQIFHTKLFIDLWKKLRTFISWEEIFDSEKQFLNSISSVFDLGILKFLLNNCEEGYREAFITYCRPVFVELNVTNQFELLEKFKDDVLKSENERKLFEDACLSYMDGFLQECRLNGVDHFLEPSLFLDLRACERQLFKNKIPKLRIGNIAVRMAHLELANKTSKWMFDSVQEKNNDGSSRFNRKRW